MPEKKGIRTYHDAVMLKESAEALCIRPDGTYVDATFGGGGHSREILKHLKTGRVFAFDQDADSAAMQPDDERLIFTRQNFRYIYNYLRYYDAIPVDGLIADLGISSHQIDTGERGFAFRNDGPLDMRMNRQQELTAETVVNDYEEERLASILWNYGELRNSRAIAGRILEDRKKKRITTTAAFASCVGPLFHAGERNKGLAKVFQAIRIEVNGEVDALKELLMQCGEIVGENGRIAFITYHSIEDRLVKNYMRSGKFTAEVERDFFGNAIRIFEVVNRKPILPGSAEIAGNNRARSAKLRVARKSSKGEDRGN